jgi:hypothetical protein
VLDELLEKESKTSALAKNTSSPDFSSLLQKEIFLKSVFVCAIETIFFVSIVKHLQVHDIL